MKTLWRDIGEFEEHECRSWKHANDIQWEARASERMKAYEKLIDRLFGE